MYDKVEGGRIINIQGLECCLPPEGYVYNLFTKKLEHRGVYKRSEVPEEQYWERPPLPDWYAEVTKAWDSYDKRKKEDDPDFYDERLEEFKRIEWDRRINGFWFMNFNPSTGEAEAVYITGLYYFLLVWWIIDVGLASFTIPHLNKLYFLQYCMEDPICFGMIDITKRRFLKTFIGGLFITEKISRTKSANGGMQSKSGKDAKKLFSKAVVDPFRRLPKFFRPEYDMSLGVNPKTEMRFQKTNVRGRKAEDAASKDELNSTIDWESADEIAYDGTKQIAYFCDEWGKTKDANVFERHEVIRYCLLDHEGRIIGKALYSTTVEQVDNESNDIDVSAKQLWDASNQNKRQENGHTESGLYRFFQTADEAKNFDKYGFPDVEANIKSILADREAAKNNPRQQAARIRKEPRNVDEAFMVNSDKCIFNPVNIAEREKFLTSNPITKRSIWFYRDENTQEVRWRDIIPKEAGFHWKVSPEFPLSPEFANKFTREGTWKKPANTDFGAIAIDGYSNSQGGQKWGSKASAWVGQRKANGRKKKAIGHLYGRPNEKDLLHEQVMLCSEYLGILAFYEHNSDDYYSYFKLRGKLLYLGIYPKILIDPIKFEKTERHRGVPTTPYSLTKQADLGVSYFENDCDDIDFEVLLEDAKTFDPDDRTKSDITVSFLILNAVLSEVVVKPPPKKNPIVDVYDGQGKLVMN